MGISRNKILMNCMIQLDGAAVGSAPWGNLDVGVRIRISVGPRGQVYWATNVYWITAPQDALERRVDGLQTRDRKLFHEGVGI